MINFVFMLTHSDSTIDRALDVVGELSGTELHYVGFKDFGATPERQRAIATLAHDLGFEVMLEVVSTSRSDEIAAVRAALAAGVDWVLGGTNAEAVLQLLRGTAINYCPFAGRVVGLPSDLEGSIEEIAESAAQLTSWDGVFGVDLLAFRHRRANIEQLTCEVVAKSSRPVIAAGSVVEDAQIEMLAFAGAWGFTIGSAIVDGLFPGGPDVASQIRHVPEVARRAGGAASGANRRS